MNFNVIKNQIENDYKKFITNFKVEEGVNESDISNFSEKIEKKYNYLKSFVDEEDKKKFTDEDIQISLIKDLNEVYSQARVLYSFLEELGMDNVDTNICSKKGCFELLLNFLLLKVDDLLDFQLLDFERVIEKKEESFVINMDKAKEKKESKKNYGLLFIRLFFTYDKKLSKINDLLSKKEKLQSIKNAIKYINTKGRESEKKEIEKFLSETIIEKKEKGSGSLSVFKKNIIEKISVIFKSYFEKGLKFPEELSIIKELKEAIEKTTIDEEKVEEVDTEIDLVEEVDTEIDLIMFVYSLLMKPREDAEIDRIISIFNFFSFVRSVFKKSNLDKSFIDGLISILCCLKSFKTVNMIDNYLSYNSVVLRKIVRS